MRRAPFIPGAPAPLVEPQRTTLDPAAYFDDAELIASCRRVESIFNRISVALIAACGLAWLLA